MIRVNVETVEQYNFKHFGKAWALRGMTFPNGSVACSWCVAQLGVSDGNPVFRSDDADGMTCDRCGVTL